MRAMRGLLTIMAYPNCTYFQPLYIYPVVGDPTFRYEARVLIMMVAMAFEMVGRVQALLVAPWNMRQFLWM